MYRHFKGRVIQGTLRHFRGKTLYAVVCKADIDEDFYFPELGYDFCPVREESWAKPYKGYLTRGNKNGPIVNRFKRLR